MKITQNTASYLESCDHRPVILNEAQKAKLKYAAKRSAIYGVIAISGLCGLCFTFVLAVTEIQSFFKKNELVFKSPVEVSVWTNRVLTVNKVEHKTILVENTKEVDKIVAESENPDIAKYICDKFGVANCRTALAVAKAESGMKCDAIGVNTNDSVDAGLWQINVPSHKNNIPVADMFDCYKSTDYAYKLFTEQGFNPWVAYWTGKYLANL